MVTSNEKVRKFYFLIDDISMFLLYVIQAGSLQVKAPGTTKATNGGWVRNGCFGESLIPFIRGEKFFVFADGVAVGHPRNVVTDFSFR